MENCKFAIRIVSCGYYAGKMYQHEREKYPVCVSDIEKAKIYPNLSKAERAKSSLYNRLAGCFTLADVYLVQHKED